MPCMSFSNFFNNVLYQHHIHRIKQDGSVITIYYACNYSSCLLSLHANNLHAMFVVCYILTPLFDTCKFV